MVGAWLDSSVPCSTHPFCRASSPPLECQYSDCVVVNLTLYRSQGTYFTAAITHSPAQRKFSRPVGGVESPWSTGGGKITKGKVTAPFTCRNERLVVGDAVLGSGSDRAPAAMAAAILTSDESNQWSAVSY